MKSLRNNEKGFTLIEIVIVMAIAAGLVLLVLLAVAGANKSSRDTKRKSMVGQLASQLEQYAANNSGNAPAAALSATYLNNISDPSGTGPTYTAAPATATAAAPSVYAGSAKCSGAGYVAGSTKQYAISYWSESGGVALCQDNQ